MREHIVVFDQPLQFGRGVPEYYNMRVFDVPLDQRDRVVGLLKHLGFVIIKEEMVDKRLFGYRKAGDMEREWCIYAQYHAGTDIHEYDNFWDKKETIELEIDKLQIEN